MKKRTIIYPLKTFKLMLFPASWLLCVAVFGINFNSNQKWQSAEIALIMLLLFLMALTGFILLSLPIAWLIGSYQDKKRWLSYNPKPKSKWLKLSWLLIIMPVCVTLIASIISYQNEPPIIHRESVIAIQERANRVGQNYFLLSTTNTSFRGTTNRSFEISWEVYQILEVDSPVYIIEYRRLFGWGIQIMLEEDTEFEMVQEKQTEPEKESIPHHHLHTTFITEERIHENMPEFTFYRIVGEAINENLHTHNVTIKIKENGEIVQIFDDLTQSFIGSMRRWIRDGHIEDEQFEIQFADFTGNGYLGMSLVQSLGGSAENLPSYFWLWDIEKGQFIRNEELEFLSSFSHVTAIGNGCVVGRVREGTMGESFGFHQYINGEFVYMYTRARGFSSETGRSFIWEYNMRTGEEVLQYFENGEGNLHHFEWSC